MHPQLPGMPPSGLEIMPPTMPEIILYHDIEYWLGTASLWLDASLDNQPGHSTFKTLLPLFVVTDSLRLNDCPELQQPTAEPTVDLISNEDILAAADSDDVAAAEEDTAAQMSHDDDKPGINLVLELNLLAARASRGDRQAVDQLLTALHPYVLRYCRHRIGRYKGTAVSAEDIAQDICQVVVEKIGSYEPKGLSFRAYVYGIAEHKIIDLFRANGRNPSVLTADVPDYVSIDEASATLRYIENTARVKNLMDALTELQKAIILLRIMYGYSAEETARMVNSTPGAVRVGQHRALTKLRKLLKGPEAESEGMV